MIINAIENIINNYLFSENDCFVNEKLNRDLMEKEYSMVDFLIGIGKYNKAKKICEKWINAIHTTNEKPPYFMGGLLSNYAAASMFSQAPPPQSGHPISFEDSENIERYLLEALAIKKNNLNALGCITSFYLASERYKESYPYIDTLFKECSSTTSPNYAYISNFLTIIISSLTIHDNDTISNWQKKDKNTIDEMIEYYKYILNKCPRNKLYEDYICLALQFGQFCSILSRDLEEYCIYERILKKYPSVFPFYALISSTCMEGRLNKPAKQVLFAQRGLHEIQRQYSHTTLDKETKGIKINLMDNLASGYNALNKTNKALSIYEELLKKYPSEIKKDKATTNTIYHNYGCALLKAKQFKQATDYFQKALSLYEDESTLSMLGKAMMGDEMYEEAESSLKKALKFIENNKNSGGIPSLADSISYSPLNANDRKKKDIYLDLITCYKKQNKLDEADKLIQMALKYYPNDVDIMEASVF